MNTKEILRNSIKEALFKLYSIDTDPVIAVPKIKKHGDYSTNVAMSIAKELEKSPVEIANNLKRELEGLETVESIEIAGPGFINFKIAKSNYKYVLDQVINQKETFGKNNNLKNKTVLIEHTSPNPTKAFHLGHLKNNVTGLAISYIYEANGAKVFRDCIDNNRGIAVAKLMYGYLKYARKSESLPIDLDYWFENKSEWLTPEEKNVDPGLFVDELYTKGSMDLENDSEVEKQIRQLVLDWEAEDEKNWELWKLTQKWVWDGYKQSMKRIQGWKFDKIWHESDIYKKGKAHVERGLKEGILQKLEDGAVLTDLKKFKLPDTIVIKNDGTSLYITQDLELTSLKKKEFNPDEMIWVIGPEQSLAMKQMFAVCSQLGFGKYEDFHHIPYGFILIKTKEGKAEKMSSRKGTQIYVNKLIDDAKQTLASYVKNPELSNIEKEEVLEKVAIAAIKYSLLRSNRLQDMVFDLNSSISFDGDSGPYLLYTYARAKSVLRKADIDVEKIDVKELTNVLTDEKEIDILKKLSLFGEAIENAQKDYMPHVIANYLYDLAQIFNNFYNSLKILNAERTEDKQARLALTLATAQVLRNGLKLLGIETVEKM